jgi:hypothetical protein
MLFGDMISEIENQMSRICTRVRLYSGFPCSWGHDEGGIYLLSDALFSKNLLSKLETQMEGDGLKIKSWQMEKLGHVPLGTTNVGMRLYVEDAEATKST